jgi:hypothetical protein
MVRIHAGPRSWDINVSAGNVAAIEVPHSTFAASVTRGIWAERSVQGQRQRIGSPFLAGVLATDQKLASLYDSISPVEDRAALTTRVATAISLKAKAAGSVCDPDAHGRRLASLLLPDVLRYDPELPVGFTFAAQNGRHPREASAIVAGAIICGRVG